MRRSDGNDALRVAVVSATTGSMVPAGNAMLHGICKGIEHFKSQCEIEPVFFDDACNPRRASGIAKEIVNTNIKFVIGHLCSNATLAALNIYDDSNILTLAPAASSSWLRFGADHRRFRICGTDSKQASVLINYAKTFFATHRCILVSERGSTGESQTAEILRYASPVCHFDVVDGSFDPDRAFERLAMDGPLAIYYAGHNATLMRQTLIAAASHYDDVVFLACEAGGNINTEGLPSKTLSILHHVMLRTDYGEETSPYALLGQAAVEVLVAGIAKAEETTPTLVTKALLTNSHETCIGHLTFGSDGESAGHAYHVVKKDRSPDVR